MAFTVRLPQPLQEKVEAFAAERGISVHALVCVALSDYVMYRTRRQFPPAPSKPLDGGVPPSPGGVPHFPSPGVPLDSLNRKMRRTRAVKRAVKAKR